MSLNQTNKIQIVRYAPPPPGIPMLGAIDSSNAVFLGRTNYSAALEEKKFIFGIKREDRRRHMYIIGKSGVGKTKIQELMIRQDIAYGYGVCLIDSNGELIKDVLDFIPKEKTQDVCIIDLDDRDYPICFNPFSNIDPSLTHQFTQNLTEMLSKQFGSIWSPSVEYIFRFTVLALLDYPRATMRGIIDMLVDKDYRNDVTSYIKDDMVKRFWSLEFDDWSSKSYADSIVPLINKFGQFLLNPILKNIFIQEGNKVDIDSLINNNKIILVNLSKAKIGDENASLFGAMLFEKIKQTCVIRSNMNENSMKDFYLYLNDFQSIATDSFEDILSESKKSKINIILSHQYIGQVPSKVEQAVLGNVGTIISFRIGGEDAIRLKPEFAPIFDVKDMINLGVGEFYIKTNINGESYDPFSAEALKILPPTHESYREEIIDLSRNKYSSL